MSVYTKPASFVPAGSLLAAELRRLLRDLGYCLQGVDDVVAHVDQLGTVTGSVVEADDLDRVEALVIRYTTGLEYEGADDWPAWTDADRWATTTPDPMPPAPDDPWHATDTLPASGWPEWARAFEPSIEDRREWAEVRDREERIDNALDRAEEGAAALVQLTAGLDAYPAPVCGGSPDERSVKLRGARSRPQPLVTDEDVIVSQGGCG